MNSPPDSPTGSSPFGGDSSHDAVRKLFHELYDLNSEERQRRLVDLAPSPNVLARVEDLIEATDGSELLDDARVEEVSASLLDSMESDLGGFELPEFLGEFRVLEKLGEGGMGVVYAVQREGEPNRQALKLIRPGLDISKFSGRFMAEVRVLAKLDHPGIASFLGSGTVPVHSPAGTIELPYLAMELVEGVPLAQHALEQELTGRQRIELLISVLDALQTAHKRGIVHRDLKPENILVTSTESDSIGRPKLLDFGVAQAAEIGSAIRTRTHTGTLIGTLPYMSPEQLEGSRRRIDARADVYAMGVLAFELLAGQLPYEVRNASWIEAARVIREDPPTRLGSLLPEHRGPLEQIVGRALEKDPADRYANAGAMADDLRRFLLGETVVASKVRLSVELKKLARRHRLAFAVGVATFAALAIGLTTTIWFALGEVAARGLAEEFAEDARLGMARASLRSAASALAEQRSGLVNLELQRIPEDLRGWEWHLLRSRSDESRVLVDLSSEPEVNRFGTEIAFTESNEYLLVRQLQRSFQVRLTEEATITDVDIPQTETGFFTRVAASPEGFYFINKDVIGFRPAAGVSLPSYDHAIPSNVEFRIAPRLRELAHRSAFLFLNDELMRFDARGKHLVPVPGLPEISDYFSCDDAGRWLAFYAKDGRFLVHDALEGNTWELGEFTDQARRALVVSPDGSRLAAQSESGFVREYRLNATRGPLVDHTYDKRHGHPAKMRYSADGSLLAVASRRPGVDVWSTTDGQRAALLIGTHAQPLNVTFDSDSKSVVVLESSGLVRQWSIADQDPRQIDLGNWIYDLEIDPATERLFVGTAGGDVEVFDAVTCEKLAKLDVRDTGGFVCSLSINREASLLCVSKVQSFRGSICLVDLETGETLWSLDKAGGEAAGAFTPDGQNLLVRWDRWLRVLDPLTGETRTEIELGTRHWSSEIPTFAFAAAADQIALNEGMKTLIFDRNSLETLETIEAGSSVHTSIAFDPSGRWLAIGLADGHVFVHDTLKETTIEVDAVHDGVVFGVAFSPDGKRLFSASNDFTFRVHETGTWHDLTQIRAHADYVHAVVPHPDGERVYTCGGDGKVKLWDTRPHAEAIQSLRDYRVSLKSVQTWLESLPVGTAPEAALKARTDLNPRDRQIVEQLLWARSLRR